jgi:hypothetical protein
MLSTHYGGCFVSLSHFFVPDFQRLIAFFGLIKHNMNFRFLLFTICFFTVGASAFAQEIMTTAGANVSNAYGSLDWSIGEPMIETASSSDNYLTQGFLQPSSIIVTAIDNYSNALGVTAYPNPCSTVLNINHKDYKVVDVEMLNASGQVLFKRTLLSTESQLELGAFAAGLYFFKIYSSDNQLISVLKVDKVK